MALALALNLLAILCGENLIGVFLGSYGIYDVVEIFLGKDHLSSPHAFLLELWQKVFVCSGAGKTRGPDSLIKSLHLEKIRKSTLNAKEIA